jgi:hypothetical protein
VHLRGAATLSFTVGVRAEPGDVLEIDVSAFGPLLRNRSRPRPRPWLG